MSRSVTVEAALNGTDITADISDDTLSLSYTDNASDSADDLSLTIQNRSRKWLRGWFPEKTDIISAKIVTHDWTGTLDCGEFTVDDVGFSGRPLTLDIKGLAQPASTDFSETEKSHTWAAITIKDVGGTIAENAGIPLIYDAELNPLLPFVSQKDQSDKAFYFDLCQKYGLTVKMYSNKIYVYDMEEMEGRKPLRTIREEDLLSWKFNDTLVDSAYSACVVKYTNQDGKLLEYKYEQPSKAPKVYNHVVQVASLAEAQQVAKAALRKANMRQTSASFSLPGDTGLVSAITVMVEGFGRFDGKYFVDKAAHSVSGGYTTNLEMHKVIEDG